MIVTAGLPKYDHGGDASGGAVEAMHGRAIGVGVAEIGRFTGQDAHLATTDARSDQARRGACQIRAAGAMQTKDAPDDFARGYVKPTDGGIRHTVIQLQHKVDDRQRKSFQQSLTKRREGKSQNADDTVAIANEI